jgi:hypothetical protein
MWICLSPFLSVCYVDVFTRLRADEAENDRNCFVMEFLVKKALARVGQNRIYTPYMTVYLVISLPKIPYVNRIYMVLANPSYGL